MQETAALSSAFRTDLHKLERKNPNSPALLPSPSQRQNCSRGLLWQFYWRLLIHARTCPCRRHKFVFGKELGSKGASAAPCNPKNSSWHVRRLGGEVNWSLSLVRADVVCNKTTVLLGWFLGLGVVFILVRWKSLSWLKRPNFQFKDA